MNISVRSSNTIATALFGVVILGAPATAAPLTYAQAVAADNPIAYWRLGETSGATTAVDETGLHNGTYSATGIALEQPGLGGGDTGALFDGLGTGRIVVPHSDTLHVTRITMESVFRWDGPTGEPQQRIIEKSTEPGSTRPVFSLQVLSTGHVQVELGFLGIEGEVIELVSNGTVPVGLTTCVTSTFDGTEVAIYLNGALDGSLPFVGDIRTDTAQPAGIGNQALRDRPFNGVIDEVALFAEALDADRIEAHCAAVPEPSTWLMMTLGAALLAMGPVRRGAISSIALSAPLSTVRSAENERP